MTVQPLRVQTTAEKQLAQQFAGLGDVAPARAAAFSRFSALGLPHKRIEAYHFTDLRAAMREATPLAPSAPASDATTLMGVSRVVIINGRIDAKLTSNMPKGVRLRSIAADLAPASISVDPVTLLNAAFAAQEILIEVEANARIEAPLTIEMRVTGDAPHSAYSRVKITLGQRASLTLIESHVVQGAEHQSNFLLALELDEGAKLDHITRIEAGGGLALATMEARLAGHCEFNSFALTSGAGLIRRQLFVTLGGSNSHLNLSGVSLLRGEDHIDTTLVVDHAAPHCESRESFRHIVDGEATGVFQGKIIVRPGAQKTDGKMMSKAILLADGATMNNKPELEIFADDVVCGHGATVGALDEDQIFYCAARGIPQIEAEALLLEAFAVEIVDPISNDDARELMLEALRRWLAERKPK